MSNAAAPVADSTSNWVDTRAPLWARPYLRLSRFDRPIGWWLLLLPCWWSAALAAGIAHDLRSLPATLALFFVGAVAMRGAGCTWNDIADRKLDAQVERTRSRPIPAWQVSVRQRASSCCSAGWARGAGAVQPLRRRGGIASLGTVAVYPFMKRVTYWPQVMLGLPFVGALMGLR